MRVEYCCDPRAHEQYYVGQTGGTLPVYSGARFQHGHGIGIVLGGLARMAMPLLKRGLGTLGREAVKAGVGFLGDVVRGKNVKRAALDHARSAAGRTLTRMTNAKKRPSSTPRDGKGIKRARTVTEPIRYTTSGRRRPAKRTQRPKDIFD